MDVTSATATASHWAASDRACRPSPSRKTFAGPVHGAHASAIATLRAKSLTASFAPEWRTAVTNATVALPMAAARHCIVIGRSAAQVLLTAGTTPGIGTDTLMTPLHDLALPVPATRFASDAD